MELIDLERIEDEAETAHLRSLIEEHMEATGSTVAGRILEEWARYLPKFVKVMPRDYKRALAEMAAEAANAEVAAANRQAELSNV
jgi:glutamate synthase domain-containing protein 3